MKNCHLILISLVLLFTTLQIIHAEEYYTAVAGNVFLDERVDSVQMIKERVHIHLDEPRSHITCKFWIYNYGERKKIAVGCPAANFRFPTSTGPITNFSCKVNGEKITDITKVVLKEYRGEDGKNSIKGRHWFKWEMTIGKNDTALIETEYDGDWGHFVCSKTSYYTIGTGATWDGPILDGRITFDHSNLFSTNVIKRPETVHGRLQPQYFDDSVVYSFSNYSPGNKEEVGFSVFQIFWLPIDESTLNPCPYSGVETVDIARKLRNEMYALHGYPFTDSTLSHYFQARKWYKIDPSFDSTRFSVGDRGFLNKLDEIEKRLLQKNETR